MSQPPADVLKKIRLIGLDVDGTLTDGRMITTPDGGYIKHFHAHDGFGIELARRAGIKTAIITAKHLRGKNIGSLLITNRTQSRADAVAKELAADVIPFDRFRTALKDVDIVISSVTVNEPILTAADIEEAIKTRQAGALFLVDIGVPRNIDQAAGKLDNVFLYDIDTLQSMVD